MGFCKHSSRQPPVPFSSAVLSCPSIHRDSSSSSSSATAASPLRAPRLNGSDTVLTPIIV
ncbi:uncharacterized protein SPAPADRAFT_60223 [Spathaspora passalidarum NRRL Y-27907]|uniref:Uncharacterized protein n=1 Tax=Spathaspora passalidarum (strain NRRL Y-27907 / 11-Y1) TaxID=619300 RepID=G3AK68_SPAPN|nr:uncharacterized protein SPAPADRAFT_60223 [Spathaspora passalidarum NRRL Y-27907]EGW32878.1 hypothetical protein SPAPADRAFT_60223 [Spathaspora passalidarum NRRL Y-27907]